MLSAFLSTQVIDTTTIGRSLMTAADAAAARTSLGLGTLATQSGTFSGTSSGTNTGDQSTFGTIAVSGQSNVVADQNNDTLTLVAGTNITITTDASTDTITIAASGGGSPGGSSGQVQFNNSSAFGGAAAVTYATTGTHLVVTAQGATIIPMCVKAAASQTANLQEWQNSSGTVLAFMNSSGEFVLGASKGLYFASTATSPFIVSVSGVLKFATSGFYSLALGNRSVGFGSDAIVAFSNSNDGAGTKDAGMARNAAGVLELNNGTAGTFRDLIVRNFRMSAPTLVPASASATGSEGQIAWDSSYIYVCTATNTWKRVAIATW